MQMQVILFDISCFVYASMQQYTMYQVSQGLNMRCAHSRVKRLPTSMRCARTCKSSEMPFEYTDNTHTHIRIYPHTCIHMHTFKHAYTQMVKGGALSRTRRCVQFSFLFLSLAFYFFAFLFRLFSIIFYSHPNQACPCSSCVHRMFHSFFLSLSLHWSIDLHLYQYACEYASVKQQCVTVAAGPHVCVCNVHTNQNTDLTCLRVS